jgi:hypothetical protein
LEAKLDPAAAAVTDERDASPKALAQPSFEIVLVRRERARRRGGFRARVGSSGR